MDPFDEFEIKPLTNGLGFHKKTVSLKDELQRPAATPNVGRRMPPPPIEAKIQSENVAKDVSNIIASIPAFDSPRPISKAGFEEESPSLVPPLPRDEVELPLQAFKSPKYRDLETPKPSATSAPVAPAPRFQETGARSVPSFSEPLSRKESLLTQEPSVSTGPLKPLQEVAFSIPAFLFDAFVVLGLSALFTGIVLAITKADLAVVLQNAQTDIPTRISLVLLVLAVTQLYMVLARSFFGNSLGEWAFEIKVGNANQRKAMWYPLAIAWRATLVLLTGLVVLPILSIIFRKDLMGRLSGLKTYRVG